MMNYDDGSWLGWILMIVFMLALWGLAAWVLVTVTRRSHDHSR